MNIEKIIVIPLWENKSPIQRNNITDEAEPMDNPGWISMVTHPELFTRQIIRMAIPYCYVQEEAMSGWL